MTLVYFPSDLLLEARMLWEIGGATIDGGATLSGLRPSTRLDGGGLWKATLNEIGLWRDDHRQSWRALTLICDNGAQPIFVPCRETIDAPWPVVSDVEISSLALVPHSDGATFSDGSMYASSCVQASIVGDVDLRATALTVRITTGADLRGGEKFSIDHADLRWRLYQIRSTVANGDGTFDVTIRPPLRAAIVDGTPVEFDRPKCTMRLATPDAMDATLEDGFFGRPSVSFIEAFPPFPD